MYRAMFVFLSFVMFSCSGTYNDYLKKGIAAQKDKKYEKAIMYYTKSIELHTKNQIAYNNRGICYKKLNKADLALADFKKAVELYKEYSEAYNNIGEMYMGKKEYVPAAEYFEKSVLFDREYFIGYYNLACASAVQGKIQDALSYLEISAAIVMKTGNLAKKFHTKMLSDMHLASLTKEKRFAKLLKDLKEFF